MKKAYCISQSTTIASEPKAVYQILKDVEKWHLWSASINKIFYLKRKEFSKGNKIQIWQPSLLPATWTITEVVENERFIYEKKHLGLRVKALHQLTQTNNGTKVELSIIMQGIFAGLFYFLSAKLTNQYLSMEAHGLKSECERKSLFRYNSN